MALIKYLNPIAFLRGKIAKDQPVVYKHMNTANKDGEKVNFTQLYTKPAPHALSAAETNARIRFKAIAARVRVAMHDEQQLAAYKAQFAAQSAYKSLRKLVWENEAEAYDRENP